MNVLSSVLWGRRLASRVTAAALLGLLGLVTGCAHGDSGADKPVGKIGLQLYSLRNQLNKSMDPLDEAHNWGVKYVELAGTYGKSPEDFKAELDKRGLVGISGHWSYDEWAKDPEAVADQAEKLGLRYAGCAWIPHNGQFDEETCRKAAEVFNHAGEVLARHHMTFFYHTHGYEFVPSQDGSLFDLLVKSTNPQNVKFEMDIFWVCFAGQDAPALLRKYPDRFELLHVKDMKKGTAEGSLSGGTDVNNDVAAGAGQLPLPAILNAAKDIGVKYYFIEDESDRSEEQIPITIAYLKQYLGDSALQ
jgi:sugar phosphate isomerase/epimerase